MTHNDNTAGSVGKDTRNRDDSWWVNGKTIQLNLILHVKVLREIVLDRGDDGLDEFKEQYEVHVHVQVPSTVLHNLDEAFHNVSVPEKRQDFAENKTN